MTQPPQLEPEPRVSVVVPVRNGAATLGALLDSLLALDYPSDRLEIIVVDNASTDDTPDILERYAPRVRSVREPKRGASAARNRGVAEAKGEVIAFTDADCVVDPRWLRGGLPLLHRERVGVVGGRILALRPCNRVCRFGEQIRDIDKAIHAFRLPYADTANWISPVAALEAVGLFDESFLRGQDSELSRRLWAAGYEFAYAPEAIVFHRNERTLWGLMHEGWTHGFASVKIARKHGEILRMVGHRRIDTRRWVKIATAVPTICRGPNRLEAACFVAFNLGKQIGKFCGSLRYRTLEL